MSRGRFFCGGSALAVSLVLSLGAQQAWAQDDTKKDDTKKDDSTEVTAVIATGTYIKGVAEDNALPIEVTTRAELQDIGSPSVAELTRAMSEVGNIQGEDNRNAGNDPGVSTINLRNMGSGRTLVLLNGQRLPRQGSGATQGDTQDTSVIPADVLQQVEVLKDGGSSIYGSDAVSGVVNFRTRRDLNGMEASANYKYVRGSKGDYDGNVQWGRRADGNNVLLSFSYTHRSELDSTDRSFDLKPALFQMASGGPGINYTGGWTQASNPGTYAFYAPVSLTGGTIYPAGSWGTAAPVRAALAAAPIGGVQIADNASTGTSSAFAVRDPLCNQLGGFRGFSINATTNLGAFTSTPVCLTNFITAENLVPNQDRYQVFADANFQVNDKWQVGSSFNFSKTVLPDRVYSGTSGGGAVSACDPYDTYTYVTAAGGNQPNQNCTPQATYFSAAVSGTSTTQIAPTSQSTQYFVSGYNPALINFITTARNFPAGAAVNSGQLYYSAAQAAQIASCYPGTTAYGNGGAFSCSAVTAGMPALGTDTPGRGQMRVGASSGASSWSPFGLGGNPAFSGLAATERDETNQFWVTNTLKGDLGEIFGTAIDLQVTANYTRNYQQASGKGILADRLQRALSGFATNLNDLSGPGGTIDRCTAAETLGIRPGATRATPWSVGNGGGWGDANGTTDGTPSATAALTASQIGTSSGSGGGYAVAGNGCYYFNPYASAIDQTRFGVQLYQNISGNDTTYGFVGTGQYQGYGTGTYGPSGNLLTAPNTGLQNSLGVINWLYEDRWRRISQDTVDITPVINGSGGFNLPGGPVAWAAGGEYRYYERYVQYDTLSDRSKNPCSFISTATGTKMNNRVTLTDQNDVNIPGRQRISANVSENYSVTCNNFSNSTATYSDSARTGVWLDGFGGTERRSTYRTVSGFGEVNLPFTDKLNAQISSRYDRTRINVGIPQAAVVTSGNAKWEVNRMLQVRASVGQTFQANDPDCDAGLTDTAQSASLITGSNLTVTRNPLTASNTYCNSNLKPERGMNYDLGLIFRPSPSLFITADLWTIKVSGRNSTLSATNLARLLVGEGGVGAAIVDADFSKPLNGQADTINCATSGLFQSIDPASGQPLVELIGADGTVTKACGSTAVANATTLNGFTGSPGAGLPNQDYGLLFNLPSNINAGDQSTRGLDLNLTYALPGKVFGGRANFRVDATYLFYLNTGAASYNGLIVGTDAKFRGTIGAPGAQVASALRGSFGFQWVKGKNRLTETTHFFSTTSADPAVFSFVVPTTALTSNYTNYNPATVAQQAACTAANRDLTVPNPGIEIPGAGPAGLGEGPANGECNIGNYYGETINGRVTFDLTYVRQLPGATTLSITGENLFDTDPPYSRQTQYYFPSTGLTALGRTVKIGVRKSFK